MKQISSLLRGNNFHAFLLAKSPKKQKDRIPRLCICDPFIPGHFCPIAVYRLKPGTILLLGTLKSLLELINTSACIDKLLLAGEERMALGANFNLHFSNSRGLGYNGLAACALDNALFVFGLDSFFHFFEPHKIISLLVGSDFTSGIIISLFLHSVNTFLKISEKIRDAFTDLIYQSYFEIEQL